MRDCSPAQYFKFYYSYVKRRGIPYQWRMDVAQEMYCQALEVERRLGKPLWMQKKRFLFGNALSHVWPRRGRQVYAYNVTQDRLNGCIERWREPTFSTHPSGRKFLKRYLVSVKEQVVELDMWEILELMEHLKNKREVDIVQNLKNNNHRRWFYNGKLYLTKDECLKETGQKWRTVQGEYVAIKIVGISERHNQLGGRDD